MQSCGNYSTGRGGYLREIWAVLQQQRQRRCGTRFVVVVVVADKEYGGNGREWRRQGVSIGIDCRFCRLVRGKLAGLASLAAVALAVECQEVTGDQLQEGEAYRGEG
ncbi:MAG: hypothetical protein JNJ78_16840 [Anaerolineae bacterium]|nr:hypothetical protein [Anaerolineae bacterium]